MRDIPLFSTEDGVSSLILKEIPYRSEAYIRVGDVQPEGLEAHLRECAAFCRMAGADRVYATGHPELERYPLHAAVLEMRGTAWVDTDKLHSVFPATEATVERWRQLHNEKMASVDNAGTLESRDEGRILSSGGAYFVHDNGQLLGIGWLEEDRLLAIAAVHPGAGELVAHSLMSIIEGADICLEVASTNHKAIRLYEKLGFLPTREVCRWYRVDSGK